MRDKNAAVYVATDRRYVEEAKASAKSMRSSNPDVRIYLKAPRALIADEDRKFFDVVQDLKDPHFGYIDKHRFLEGVSERKVVFLDGDTFICGKIDQGFKILDRFDIALAHAPVRTVECGYPPIPEFNAGVIFACNYWRVRRAMRSWPKEMTKEEWNKNKDDQAALKRIIWKKSLRIYTLPPEYNARIAFPLFLSGPVVILHGRHANIEELAKAVNEKQTPRILAASEK